LDVPGHSEEMVPMIKTRFNLLTVIALMCSVLLFPDGVRTIHAKGIVDFPVDFPEMRAPSRAEVRRRKADPDRLRRALKKGVEALKKGDSVTAGLILDGLEQDYPVLGDYILFYRIEADLSNNDPRAALRLAECFLRVYPESLLEIPVRIRCVQAEIELKRFQKAVSDAGALLGGGVPEEESRKITLLRGSAYEGLGDWVRAQRVYQKLFFENPVTPEGMEAERRLRRITEERGIRPGLPDASLFFRKVQGLYSAFRFDSVIAACGDLERNYPKEALTDRARLLKADALIRLGKVDEGRKVYERLNRSSVDESVRAEALYQLGNVDWNRNHLSSAKRILKILVRKFPRSPWRLKAEFALGRIYEAEKNRRDALKHYQKIGRIDAGDPLAAQGGWRIGWVEYKSGRFRAARDAFTRCMRSYPASSSSTAALYWKGRCEEKLRHVEAARAIYRQLVKKFPWDYYGVIARNRLAGDWIFEKGSEDPVKNDSGFFDPLPIQAKPGSKRAFHLVRALELMRIGFDTEAGEELDAVRKAGSWKRDELLSLAVLYEKSRNYFKGVRLLAGLPLSPGQVSLRRFLYPLAYWSAVERLSRENGLSPFLILAVMRQESLFQADSLSPADARGLMQIIPPTGKRIAENLSVDGFTPDDLYEPYMNLTFGAWYLKSLLDRFDGDLIRVFAGYNAGAARADEWWERDKGLEADERIESIPFRETRGYVKKVLRNLENYRRLYRDLRTRP